MTAAETFDAVILGTGQAGKPLAAELAEAGWRVAIVERGRVGGTCIVEGCTPTKTMVASARVAHLVSRAGEYGVTIGDSRVDLVRVRARKRAIVDAWSEGAREGLEDQDGVELVRGEARFIGPDTVRVAALDGGERVLVSERIFVNVGARHHVPSVPGLGVGGRILDSTSIMELGEVPGHLVVLGGGFIGVEFAQMFRRFGARVTVLESGDRLLGREDEDLSEALAVVLEGEGVDLEFGARVVAAEGGRGEEPVRLRLENGGVVEGTHILLAVGRTPNTDTLGFQAAGLRVDDRGHLVVNDRLETNVPGIWALGDVNGGPPFTHVAYDDYRIVAANVLGKGARSREGRLVPWTLFTDPQLGRVGMTESDARAAGIRVGAARLPMDRVARAIETDETRGFMKAVVDLDTDRIVGAAVLGVEGGEVLAVLQVAMLGGLGWRDLRDGVFAHPTMAESLNNLFTTLDEG
jgi:pyruvate/2-oxoglutarate dehydrogenase complex dihydrolipoamide dehydrogenase (E3) component